MYKITVLITFYNQEKYVDDCLSSVFSQETNFPFCVIVGDDGSSDTTVERIRDWEQRYPNRIDVYVWERSPKKKESSVYRQSQNKLNLIGKVQTEYFIFLDGDDYWTDNHKLQIQYDILEDPNNKDCIGCGHMIRVYNDKREYLSYTLPDSSVREGKYDYHEYWRGMYFHTNTLLFRSERIPMLQYALLQDEFNDNMITFCFIPYGRLYYLPYCMADYRVNKEGLHMGAKQSINHYREVMSYEIECLIDPKIKNIAGIRHLDSFKFFLRNGLDHEMAEPYYEAARKYPLRMTINLYEKGRLLYGHQIIMDKCFVLWVVIMRYFQRKKRKKV